MVRRLVEERTADRGSARRSKTRSTAAAEGEFLMDEKAIQKPLVVLTAEQDEKKGPPESVPLTRGQGAEKSLQRRSRR